ncbi:MAG: hypothetical protein QGF00_24775, partial [Planctomycetota bacterium]|nr:hypothetical protein [Planctomycetota bacterium]
MKYYAVATDTIRDEPFGLVVRNGSGSICYGFHAAGSEWADLYNDGEIKTLEEGLPPEVELGHFGQLHFDVEEMLEKSPETIPSPEMSVLVESEWLPNNSTGIGLTHVPLVKISKKSRQLAINYKAHAFLADSRHSSLLLKTRLSGGRLTPDDSHTRRTAKELLNTKMLILTQRYRNEDAVSEEEMQTKALGRQIGRGARRARRIGRAAGRSAMGFDPDARDADLDMLVQEGTAWERPALPGKPDLPGARSTRRTPADRDRAAMRQRQGGLASRRGSSMYASPRRGWSRAAGRDDAYGNIWLQPDDNPAREMDIERGIERFEKDILDQTVGQIYDEFEIRGLERIFEQFGDDDDERDRLIDETLIRDLPEELRNEVEGIAYNYAVDNPDAMLDYGADEGPDPYDEWRDRRDSGLASRRDPDGGMRSMREHIPGTRAWRNRREDREREERFDAQQERDRERWIEHTQGNGPPLAPAPDGYIRMPNGYRLLEDTDENRKLFGIEGRAMPPDPDPWDADRDTRPKRRAEHTPSTLEQLLAGTHRKLSKLRAGRGREEPDRDRPEERLDPRHHPEIKRPSSFRDRGFQQANRENPDFDRDNFSTFEKWQKAVHEEILRQDRLSDTGAGHRVEAKRPPLPPRDGGPRKRGERSQGRLVNPRARLGGGERYVRYGDLDENGDLPVDIPGKWVDAHGVDTIDPRKGEWSLHREGHTVRDPRSRGGGTGYLPRGEIRFTDPEWEDYRHALGPDNLPLMDTHLREVREDIRTNKALLEAVEAERVQLDADARHFVVQGRRSGKPKHRHSNDNGQPTNASLQRQAGLEFLTQSMSEDLPDIDRGRQAIVRGEQEWLDQQVTDSERRLQHLADQIVKDEKLLEVLEEHETYVERVDMPEPGSWVPSRVGEPNLTHRGQESDDDDMIDPTRIPLQMGEGMRSRRGDAESLAFYTALDGTEEDRQAYLDNVEPYEPGFQSTRLGREVKATRDTRNSHAAAFAETSNSFSFKPGGQPGSKTLTSGTSSSNEKFKGMSGGELYDSLTSSGWAFFPINKQGHTGEVFGPDRVTANTKMRAVESGLANASSKHKDIVSRDGLPHLMPGQILDDAVDKILEKRWNALGVDDPQRKNGKDVFKVNARLDIYDLDFMDEEHWSEVKDALRDAGMPADEKILNGAKDVFDGIVRKNAPSDQKKSPDDAHMGTEKWLRTTLGLGTTVYRKDPRKGSDDPDRHEKVNLEITNDVLIADLRNVAATGKGWLGSIPPESYRHSGTRVDGDRDMDGASAPGANAKVGHWRIADYTQEGIDTRSKDGATYRPLYANARGLDESHSDLADAVQETAVTRQLDDYDTTIDIAEEIAELRPPKKREALLEKTRRYRADLADQREKAEGDIDFNLLQRNHEALNNDPGFRSRRGGPPPQRDWSNRRTDLAGRNPYDPDNDPPRMVRQMRSDGTSEDVIDPEWLKRHPEGVQGWLDANDPDDGPESRFAQDPDAWRESQMEIRDMMDQRIEESLNRMTDEMRQEEFTRGTELEDAGRQALDDIEWGREMGFRSYIDREDFDPARDLDPDIHHDDPFMRDQKLNESIFNDRMSPMTFDQVADKYDMDRVEVRRREMEHMNLLAGQERYNAQPNLNQRIYEDRVRHRMTLEEAAKKYDMDRAEVRMREVTHANSLSGQEKYDAQPNLNRRIAESRMRGMSLDEATERFNMDPDEVRSREVTYLGAVPEVIQAAQDAIDEPSYTGGFRSV